MVAMRHADSRHRYCGSVPSAATDASRSRSPDIIRSATTKLVAVPRARHGHTLSPSAFHELRTSTASTASTAAPSQRRMWAGKRDRRIHRAHVRPVQRRDSHRRLRDGTVDVVMPRIERRD